MADFRKWLFAFAIVALALALQIPASAQVIGSGSIICTASAGATPTLRAEGVTELVGDVTLTCSGGTPTAAGVAIPQANVSVFLNTNVTSRLISLSNSLSEALLTIDEPFPATGAVPTTATPAINAATTQLACGAVNTPTGAVNCAMTGTGGGVGAAGPYNGSTGHYNIFQGAVTSVNTVTWLGVPIDAPGTNNTRTIRITNIRANAALLGVSSSLIPTQIFEYISISGSQPITLTNSQVVVGFVVPGLTSTNSSQTFTQCNNLNASRLLGTGGVVTSPINIIATEGFATAFKVRSYAQTSGGGNTLSGGQLSSAATSAQNVLGFSYFTESGFVGSPALGPGAAGFGTTTGSVGLADTGTQITFSLASLGTGVSVFVPSVIYLYPSGTYGLTSNVPTTIGANATGYAVLVSGTTAGAITVSGTTGSVTYEVLFSNPNEVEQAVLPITPAFISNTTSNLPGIGQSTLAVNFAPLSTVPTATSEPVPIPRFAQPYTARNIFAVNTCTCDLLFPFVTNQAGFDTGIAIANTSMDPFGTVNQTGTVKLNYYGNTAGGGAAPTAQTSTAVAAGTELVFTLSSGGGNGIAATPGFQGYMIAVANFQFCHGFAFISDVGAQKLAEGYLAIELDTPFWAVNGFTRTLNAGESQGN